MEHTDTKQSSTFKIIEITFVKTEKGKVIARADVHFDGFILKGFKVIRDSLGKEYVTPPSYESPKGWRKTFITDSKEEWQKIQARILDDFSKKQMKESADEIYEKDD